MSLTYFLCVGNFYDRLRSFQSCKQEGEQVAQVGALHLQHVPVTYREMVAHACSYLLEHYIDIQAIVIIGSIAAGDFGPESDVDVLYVKETAVRPKEQWGMQKQLDEKVQLIFFDVARFKEHIAQRTTMAHSVARGIALYEEFLGRYCIFSSTTFR